MENSNDTANAVMDIVNAIAEDTHLSPKERALLTQCSLYAAKEEEHSAEKRDTLRGEHMENTNDTSIADVATDTVTAKADNTTDKHDTYVHILISSFLLLSTNMLKVDPEDKTAVLAAQYLERAEDIFAEIAVAAGFALAEHQGKSEALDCLLPRLIAAGRSTAKHAAKANEQDANDTTEEVAAKEEATKEVASTEPAPSTDTTKDMAEDSDEILTMSPSKLVQLTHSFLEIETWLFGSSDTLEKLKSILPEDIHSSLQELVPYKYFLAEILLSAGYALRTVTRGEDAADEEVITQCGRYAAREEEYTRKKNAATTE
jgi:hypothetical protein